MAVSVIASYQILLVSNNYEELVKLQKLTDFQEKKSVFDNFFFLFLYFKSSKQEHHKNLAIARPSLTQDFEKVGSLGNEI